MGALDHPMKEGVEHLRGVIRAIDPRIVEEVKWNAPSYKLDGTSSPNPVVTRPP
jgi:hypothetical protein